MNIAYFRKTQKSVEEAVAAVKASLSQRKISVTGEKKFPSGSVLIQFVDEVKTAKILERDRTLLGLVPMAVLVEKGSAAVSVGLVNPQLLAGAQNPETPESAVEDIAREMKGLVNEAAGVGEPKIEKVRLYSTATCPYCRMEKDYLEKNNIKFDLAMVDTDRQAAEEMVQKSGQMGVPQTEVVFDDGDSELIIGFDKGRLNQLLGIGK